MKQLLKDAEKIKSLEIQGATNIALAAIDYLHDYAKRFIDRGSSEDFLNNLEGAKIILFNTRPTEPALRNGLNLILNRLRKSKHDSNQEELLELISNYK
ncbi:MAG: hypothetical protein ACFFCG_08530, partial [Promethearchaeota archaeon]